jgi:outer membrane protein TolC
LLPALLAASATAAAPNPVRLSLSQAIDAAIGANPEARRVRELVNETKLQVREARAEALPTLDFQSRYVHSLDPGLKNSPFFSRLLEGPDALPPEALDAFSFDNYAWSFSLEQPIYTFGRVKGALRAARNELEGVGVDVRTEERRLARSVAFAYYDLQLARQRKRVLESEELARQRQLEQVETRLELEDATRLELLRAQVALANLKPRLVGADNDIRLTTARFNETLGRPIGEPVELVDGLALPAPLPEVPDVPELLERASSGRSELRRFALDRAVLKAAEQVTRSDVLPEIVGNASFGIDTFTVDNFTDLEFKNWSVGVSLRWTLFDGLKSASTIGRYRSQQLQSQLAEASFRASLGRELEQARGTWRGAVEALDASELAVRGAEEAQRVAEESYRWGAVTFLDVLEAERALREAELTRAEALHMGLTALADLKYLIGLRPDADLAAPAGPAVAEPER